MRWTSILAIYTLCWAAAGFLLLPFEMRSQGVAADDERIAGQADSAPANFRAGRIMLRATILAAIMCAAFVANYIYGWIGPQDINVFGNGPSADY